jgi:hypothetical protein
MCTRHVRFVPGLFSMSALKRRESASVRLFPGGVASHTYGQDAF